MRSWLTFGAFLAVTTILTRFIPFSAFFRNVDTLIHEMSHAVATLVLSGKVMYIFLFADQSGVTYSSYTNNWMSIPISLAGYTGSALFAILLFRLYAAKREKAGLITIAAIALIALALFVRNGYGMIWCAGFAALTLIISFTAPPWLRKGYYLLIAFICLVESVVSSFTILLLSFTTPGSAGDAANLAKATIIPAPLWAILFVAFSLWCAKYSATLLLRQAFRPASGGESGVQRLP